MFAETVMWVGELQDRGRRSCSKRPGKFSERISCPLAPRPQLCLQQVQARSFLCSYHFFLHFLQKKHQKTKLQTRRRKTTENRTIGRYHYITGLAWWLSVKEFTCQRRETIGLIPGSGSSLKK